MSAPQSRYEDDSIRIFNPDDERRVVAEAELNVFEETVKKCKKPTDGEWILYENEKGPGYKRDEFLVVKKETVHKHWKTDVVALSLGLFIGKTTASYIFRSW